MTTILYIMQMAHISSENATQHSAWNVWASKLSPLQFEERPTKNTNLVQLS